MGSNNEQREGEAWVCILTPPGIATHLWTNYQTFLCLSVQTYNMGIPLGLLQRVITSAQGESLHTVPGT